MWQDDKLRWHRCWCKAENRDMRFYIYEDNSEEVLLRSFSLENSTTRFDGQVTSIGKDNSFLVSGVLYDAVKASNGYEMEASTVPVDVYLAAYTDSECKKWKDMFHWLLSSHNSIQVPLSSSDGNSWLSPVLALDSASSSSSNFSSNRDSMVSNTSSLVNACRMSSRSDLEHTSAEDSARVSVSKQQQPLPSPPHTTQVIVS